MYILTVIYGPRVTSVLCWASCENTEGAAFIQPCHSAVLEESTLIQLPGTDDFFVTLR